MYKVCILKDRNQLQNNKKDLVYVKRIDGALVMQVDRVSETKPAFQYNLMLITYRRLRRGTVF